MYVCNWARSELTGDRDGAGELYETALTASVANGDRDAEAWCRTSIGELMRKRSQYDEAAEWLRKHATHFGYRQSGRRWA